MEKIECGMYVRTKNGYIAKCVYVEKDLENIYGFDNTVRRSFDDAYDFIYCKEQEEYITKTSHNIIDLIEEGDYIRIITSPSFDYVYYSYGKLVIRDDVEIKNYSNKFIAEIITKEQFESISYKVED